MPFFWLFWVYTTHFLRIVLVLGYSVLKNTRYSLHNVTNEHGSWDFIFNLDSHFRFPYCWIKFDTFYSFQEFSEKTFLRMLFYSLSWNGSLHIYVMNEYGSNVVKILSWFSFLFSFQLHILGSEYLGKRACKLYWPRIIV